MSALFHATDLVVPFELLRMTDVESVGGKNASLGEMISQLPNGVLVPTGFATTAYAFNKFLNKINIKMFEPVLDKIIQIADGDIYKAVLEMPKVMWQLFLVYLFQWYALMCYWQNNAKSIALSVWDATPKDKSLYENAVEWNGLIGAFGFVITFSVFVARSITPTFCKSYIS